MGVFDTDFAAWELRFMPQLKHPFIFSNKRTILTLWNLQFYSNVPESINFFKYLSVISTALQEIAIQKYGIVCCTDYLYSYNEILFKLQQYRQSIIFINSRVSWVFVCFKNKEIILGRKTEKPKEKNSVSEWIQNFEWIQKILFYFEWIQKIFLNFTKIS